MTQDKPIFDPSNMPRFVPPSWLKESEAQEYLQQYDEICCPQPECAQRDYNRACILMLNSLARSYAALLLVRDATRNLWKCDDAGHTVNCKDPACTFGRQMDESLGMAQQHFERTIVGICVHLSTVSVDLTPQWQDFSDMEMAGFGLFSDNLSAEAGTYREMLRREAVDYDEIEFARWFRPPPDGPAV